LATGKDEEEQSSSRDEKEDVLEFPDLLRQEEGGEARLSGGEGAPGVE
jgi:hypothetical protein